MLALATSTLVAQAPAPQSSATVVTPGAIVPRQACAAQPEQSYALYLPSHYAPDKRWPIIYAFDPDGRGNIPVELMKDAAERHGYIVVGSNNSRNGAWKLEGDSAKAMWDDTHARLAIDDRRVYFAGFSGGGRVASVLAQSCKCSAGVLLSGAGFGGAPPSRDNVFAVFAAVGTFDFNYPELSNLDDKLEQAGFPHVLRHFEGPHQWAPLEVMDEATAWFELIAMKENREPRDDSFIKLQETAAVARARTLEQAGQPYEAWREYRQAIATFAGLADTASLQQASASLAQQEAVRDGARREKQEFQEQEAITRDIYTGLAALRGGGAAAQAEAPSPPEQPSVGSQQRPASPALGGGGGNAANSSDIFHETEQKIVELRQRTASEKHADKLRIERRALAGVFIAAGELGDQSLAAGNFSAAKGYFQLASDANPESAGALQELAKAMALDNDRKGSLKALRRAKDVSKDPGAFSAWLNQEPAFAKLREEPQFRALLANP